jgi:hypothetical protein
VSPDRKQTFAWRKIMGWPAVSVPVIKSFISSSPPVRVQQSNRLHSRSGVSSVIASNRHSALLNWWNLSFSSNNVCCCNASAVHLLTELVFVWIVSEGASSPFPFGRVELRRDMSVAPGRPQSRFVVTEFLYVSGEFVCNSLMISPTSLRSALQCSRRVRPSHLFLLS